jgi:hypothetical protein
VAAQQHPPLQSQAPRHLHLHALHSQNPPYRHSQHEPHQQQDFHKQHPHPAPLFPSHDAPPLSGGMPPPAPARPPFTPFPFSQHPPGRSVLAHPQQQREQQQSKLQRAQPQQPLPQYHSFHHPNRGRGGKL